MLKQIKSIKPGGYKLIGNGVLVHIQAEIICRFLNSKIYQGSYKVEMFENKVIVFHYPF